MIAKRLVNVQNSLLAIKSDQSLIMGHKAILSLNVLKILSIKMNYVKSYGNQRSS